MMVANETTTTNRKANSYDTYNIQDAEESRGHSEKREHRSARASVFLSNSSKYFPHLKQTMFPGNLEDESDERDIISGRRIEMEPSDMVIEDRSNRKGSHRGLRRRLFLFLTEPSSSCLSAVFFFVLVVSISASNLITILQTMSAFQYRPTECDFCREGGGFYDHFEDYKNENSDESDTVVECVCPLCPFPYLERLLGFMLYFFAFEWTLRVLSFVPVHPRSDTIGQWGDWFNHLISPTTLVDALAIWPYFIETYDLRGLISLRILRLLRVFQFFRLGSYNTLFVSLTTVLYKSIEFLKLYIVIIFFGATIFGSLLFWLEQGEWKYWEPTGDFQYVRISINGEDEEISPFSSIPAAFWFVICTVTTVGYGDYYPTSKAGQWVSACAMLTGVLVIALPVGVFSDLWSDELKEVKGLESLFDDDSSGSDDDQNDGSLANPEQEYLVNADCNETQPLREENQKINFEEDKRFVVLERDDLNEIVSSVRCIREKQRRIQRILKKYAIVHEDDQR